MTRTVLRGGSVFDGTGAQPAKSPLPETAYKLSNKHATVRAASVPGDR
jgi:hypothetical protein